MIKKLMGERNDKKYFNKKKLTEEKAIPQKQRKILRVRRKAKAADGERRNPRTLALIPSRK